MERATLMQQKIAEQRKLPKHIKEKLINITFINLLISIALMIYLLAINILYLNEDITIFSNSTKIMALILIVIDVLLFEISYRKDSGGLWIHSFELLICSVLVLAIPYIYQYHYVRNVLMFAPAFFSIYYIVKAIFIYVIEKKKYQNNLSDVKEIIKDEEEGYLDDINLIEDVKELESQKTMEKNIVKAAKKVKKKGE